jgi:hypothetical protein
MVYIFWTFLPLRYWINLNRSVFVCRKRRSSERAAETNPKRVKTITMDLGEQSRWHVAIFNDQSCLNLSKLCKSCRVQEFQKFHRTHCSQAIALLRPPRRLTSSQPLRRWSPRTPAEAWVKNLSSLLFTWKKSRLTWFTCSYLSSNTNVAFWYSVSDHGVACTDSLHDEDVCDRKFRSRLF